MMRVETLSTYILELPNGEELRLNESAWNAVQLLLKKAKREAYLEAATVVSNMDGYVVTSIAEDIRSMAKELE